MGGKICHRLMFHGISVLSKEHASIDQCSDCAICHWRGKSVK